MIAKNKLKMILLASVAMMGVASHAQMGVFSHAQAASTDTVPDIRKCFDILIKNRITYNQYNDSIFKIHSHDDWVEFFLHRAKTNHQLFLANKVAIETITDYFKKDKQEIPQVAYDSLFYAYTDYVASNKTDPFISIQLAKILEKHNEEENLPDSANTSNYINVWMGFNYANIARLGNTEENTRLAYEYFKKLLDKKSLRYPGHEKQYPIALVNLTKSAFLLHKIESIEESRSYIQILKDIASQQEIMTSLGEELQEIIKRNITQYDMMLLRNIYQTDSTVMSKQEADSLRTRIIQQSLARKDLDPRTRSRVALMQVQMGQLTPDEALHAMLKRYKPIRRDMKNSRLSDTRLTEFLSPFFVLLYLNDLSTDSYAKKRKRVLSVCQDIELAYKRRKDQQKRTQYIAYLNQFTTLPRITKYLKPAERVHFLNTLNVSTQVTTYAHSVHVSMIAEALMNGIIRYQPELLVNTLGDLQVTEVIKHKKQYLDFIHDAAMYHDLGKNSIISVVHNDYRPLTDEEFAIIKTHPRLGLQYLELAPSLAKYRDTTLGHHKWYNGKGGYPMDFDNTKSPVRIMIDIVTLSDCLQAATERVGRNYKGDKTFNTVMEEFRRDAGTRYNPDLVNLIDSQPDLSRQLAHLVEGGWLDIYYNIYSQFIDN